MTALEDRRPVAATTARINDPSVIAHNLFQLLVENPALELASIRFIPNDDGTVGIAGRVGELVGVECPQCHQPAGRPHTEYCTLAPDKIWDGVLPLADREIVDGECPLQCGVTGAHYHRGDDEIVRVGPRLVCRRCNGYGLLGVAAGVNPVPCPDCMLPASEIPIDQTSQQATRTSQPHTVVNIHGQATPDLAAELRKAITRARQDGRS